MASGAVLGGISAGAGGAVNGNMQLYNIDKKVSQPLQGHAASFATLNLPGRDDPAQVHRLSRKEEWSFTREPPKLFVMRSWS